MSENGSAPSQAPATGLPAARAGLPRVRGATLPTITEEMTQRRAEEARSYSRFVAWMKLLLPSTAVILSGVVLAWPQISEKTEGLAVEFAALEQRQADLGSVINPRYLGTDDQNQPYTVTADLATEMDDGSDRVRLSNPKGDITQNTGRWLSVTSELGYLTDNNQRVELDHNVMLYRDDGFQFETNRAFIRMDESMAYGEQPVKGQSDGMRITSQGGFSVTEGGDVIIFQGKAHLVLDDAESAGFSTGLEDDAPEGAGTGAETQTQGGEGR